jgi:ribosomal protein S18 acetylase RimI-like enzyme
MSIDDAVTNGTVRPSPKPAAPKSVSVREMELEDIPPVFALGEELFTADRWPTLYRTWNQYDLIERFASDGEFCLVAELDERLVGFAIGTVITKRNSAWDYGHLLWLGVEPGHGGKGIGKRLVRKMTELFIEGGARMMIVDTDVENEGALNFFRGIGFGQETQHIYLYRNLTSLPGYKRKLAEEKAARPRRPARRVIPAPLPSVSVRPDIPVEGEA